uniref:Uncharacterized protein n=1 Tax=viral metagenome TaxID=1070528 RepID=A0A6M3IQ92_9ZZZZ
MAYTDTTAVRLLTNLTTGDISDADVTSIIAYATSMVNSDINVNVTRERVTYVDNTRQNQINSSNTIFYVQNWRGKFLADRDNDGGVDTGDVVVYLVASDGTETTATVSAIDSDDCKITLSSAPASGYKVYISYSWCYKDPATPDANIKLATTYLTAALCYKKIYDGLSPEQVYGNVRFKRDLTVDSKYYKLYEDSINKINSKSSGTWAEGEIF